MQERPSRRDVLASLGTLTAVGLAGCAGGSPQSATTTTSDPATETRTAGATTEATTEAAPSVDWSEVGDFRRWLTEYSTLPSSNARFDYQSVGLDRVVGTGRTSFLDVAVEDVDSVLFQSGNVFLLGDFDASALADDVEASDEHEVTGEHAGYTTGEATETGSEVAVGEAAVLAGSDLAVYIDTHRGERERLEETDPVFTRIFERLPDRGIVAGQRGMPAGGEIDTEAIEAWGHSMASLDADTGTWVYALEPDTGDETVAELESDLAASAFTEEVTDRSEDGRFVTFTATVADLS